MNDSFVSTFNELLLSSFDNVLARLFLRSTCLVTLGGNALAAAGMSAGLTALTTAHRVVNGVHDNTAVAGTAAQPTAAAGLTADFEVVLGVGNNAHSGAAGLKDHAHFAAGHLDDGVLAVTRHELGVGTGATHHLGTLARTELDVVDKGTEGDFGEGQRVAHFGGGTCTGHNGLTDFQTLGAEDVTLLTVGVVHQRDTRSAVGVILDGLDSGGDTVLVALEVDDAVQLLVATAHIAHGHLTLVVAATRFAVAKHQTLFRLVGRDIIVGDDEFVTLSGGCRFNFL